ncbi:MAG: AMP-binding protein [Burkholderiales bacterium]|nr:AMP-binding protein [Burkholderiales bacterium]
MTLPATSVLECIYQHEKNLADHVFLTQPIGQGRVLDYTWAQTVDQSRRMAAHLKTLGLPHGAKIAILSKNCAHFFMTEMAIWMAGYTTVAIFPTESADTVKFVLEHSESSLLFVGKLDEWHKQAPGVPQDLPRIALPLAPETPYQSWDAITSSTEPLLGDVLRDDNDLAMIIYTSGSTGQPKGAMHNFARISAVGHGIAKRINDSLGDNRDHRMLSYLPLAHVFERAWAETVSLVHGRIHMFFAESLDTFILDLNRAQPTIFVSVPRLWLKFQQGVFAKMPARKLNLLLSLPFIGKVVAKKVLTGLGLDKVEMAGSGSAPLPPDLIRWYRRLGLNLVEGYAMTEDFAYSHSSDDTYNEPGYVGIPYEGVQARISEEGEILIKSPGQMVGYYKRPDLDAQSFTADGFFKTGDLGSRRPDGQLKITGRLKELFKTSKGKYVAPAPIENLLNAHPMIELSMVSGSGFESAYALVVLAEDLRPKLQQNEVRSEVEKALVELLAKVNKEVAEYERLKMLVVAAQPWSIENGCLTPTMKIKRSHIEYSVQHQLDNWYANSKVVIWS